MTKQTIPIRPIEREVHILVMELRLGENPIPNRLLLEFHQISLLVT